MNQNQIVTRGFSNRDSEKLYRKSWPAEPRLAEQHYTGRQCGGCSFFAPFNEDWGLCCHPRSRHRLETVFEHFTCPSFQREGWGPHSFSTDQVCRCGGLDVGSTDIVTIAKARTPGIRRRRKGRRR